MLPGAQDPVPGGSGAGAGAQVSAGDDECVPGNSISGSIYFYIRTNVFQEVSRTECRPVTRNKCTTVTEQVPRRTCAPVTREKCEQVTQSQGDIQRRDQIRLKSHPQLQQYHLTGECPQMSNKFWLGLDIDYSTLSFIYILGRSLQLCLSHITHFITS